MSVSIRPVILMKSSLLNTLFIKPHLLLGVLYTVLSIEEELAQLKMKLQKNKVPLSDIGTTLDLLFLFFRPEFPD